MLERNIYLVVILLSIMPSVESKSIYDDIYQDHIKTYKIGFAPDTYVAAGIGAVVGAGSNIAGQLIRNGGTNNFSFSDAGWAAAKGAGSTGLAAFEGGPLPAVWTVNGIIAEELGTGVANNLENKYRNK